MPRADELSNAIKVAQQDAKAISNDKTSNSEKALALQKIRNQLQQRIKWYLTMNATLKTTNLQKMVEISPEYKNHVRQWNELQRKFRNKQPLWKKVAEDMYLEGKKTLNQKREEALQTFRQRFNQTTSNLHSKKTKNMYNQANKLVQQLTTQSNQLGSQPGNRRQPQHSAMRQQQVRFLQNANLIKGLERLKQNPAAFSALRNNLQSLKNNDPKNPHRQLLVSIKNKNDLLEQIHGILSGEHINLGLQKVIQSILSRVNSNSNPTPLSQLTATNMRKYRSAQPQAPAPAPAPAQANEMRTQAQAQANQMRKEVETKYRNFFGKLNTENIQIFFKTLNPKGMIKIQKNQKLNSNDVALNSINNSNKRKKAKALIVAFQFYQEYEGLQEWRKQFNNKKSNKSRVQSWVNKFLPVGKWDTIFVNQTQGSGSWTGIWMGMTRTDQEYLKIRLFLYFKYKHFVGLDINNMSNQIRRLSTNQRTNLTQKVLTELVGSDASITDLPQHLKTDIKAKYTSLFPSSTSQKANQNKEYIRTKINNLSRYKANHPGENPELLAFWTSPNMLGRMKRIMKVLNNIQNNDQNVAQLRKNVNQQIENIIKRANAAKANPAPPPAGAAATGATAKPTNGSGSGKN